MPWLWQANAALQKLTVVRDNGEQCDGSVQCVRRDARQPVKTRFHTGLSSSPLLRTACSLRGSRTAAGGVLGPRCGCRRKARECAVGVAAFAHYDRDTHQRGVADELRDADALFGSLAFQQFPQVVREANGRRVHRHANQNTQR